MSKPKIGLLGSGDVGQRLGAGFAKAGYEVMMGTREPSKEEVASWVKENAPAARAGSHAEAAEFGDVIVLATAWSGTENAVRLAGAGNLAGKVLIDVTNPLEFTEAGPVLAVGHTDSAGEHVQRWAPDAKVVKCWNVIGNPYMMNPDFPEGKADMFICGNDEGAKKTVAGILDDFGWPPVIDLGGIENSRYLEPMAMVWIRHFMQTGSGDHGFKLLRK